MMPIIGLSDRYMKSSHRLEFQADIAILELVKGT